VSDKGGKGVKPFFLVLYPETGRKPP